MNKLTRNTGKYIKKIFLFAFLALILASGGIFVFLQTDNGKEVAANIASSALTRSFGTEVEIEKLHISLTGEVNIEELLIKDHHDEKLFSADSVFITQPRYFLTTGKWSLSKVDLFQPVFHGRKYEGEEKFNYAFLTGSKEESTDDKKFPGLRIGKLHVKNGIFENIDRNVAEKQAVFQQNHFSVQSNEIEVSGINMSGDRVLASIDFLHIEEKSGFELRHLQGQFNYLPGRITVLNMVAVTEKSRFDGKFSSTWDPENFSKISEDLEISSGLRHLEISPSDIQYFTEEEVPFKESLTLQGEVSGSINSLRLTDMEIWFGNESLVTGDYRINELNNFPEIFLDWEIKEGLLTHADMQQFYPDFPMMDELSRLQRIELTGRITGFINDFVAYGEFETPLGNSTTDINFMLEEDPYRLSYSGSLSLDEFDAGTYIGEAGENIGKVSLSADVDGKGLHLDNLDVNFSSAIEKLNVAEYEYQNANIEGRFHKRLFEGNVKVDDPNAQAEFLGSVDFQAEEPVFDFKATLENANLKALNLAEKEKRLSTEAIINLTGNSLNNSNGTIRFLNGKLEQDETVKTFDSLYIATEMHDNGNKDLAIYSDMVTASIDGRFNFSELPDLVIYSLSEFVNPRLLPEISPDFDYQAHHELNLEARFHDPQFLAALIMHDVELSKNAYIKSTMKSQNTAFILNAHIPYFSYQGYSVEDMIVEANGRGKWLNLTHSTNAVSRNGEVLVDRWTANSRSMQDSLNFEAGLSDNQNQREVNLDGQWYFEDERSYLELKPSDVVLNDTTWTLSGENLEYYPDSLITLSNLKLSHGQQEVSISGGLNEDLTEPLNITLNEVEWVNIHPFISGFLTEFQGVANGTLTVSHILDKPRLQGGLDLAPAYLQDEYLGHAYLGAYYDSVQQTNKLSAEITSDEGARKFTASGDLDLTDGGSTDLYLHFFDFDASGFQSYVDGVVSDVEGKVSGNARVFGPFGDVNMDASVDVKEGAFTVDYLQTRYTFEDQINFSDAVIPLSGVTIKDHRGNEATVHGSIQHRLFRNMVYDVNVETQNFQVLNTGEDDNSIYYGAGYGTGNVSFNGHEEDMLVTIRLRSEYGTHLTIPAQSGQQSGKQLSFIRFSQEETVEENDEIDYAPSGMEFDMEFDFTPDAEISLHFNAFGRDVLRGRGDGHLRMIFEEGGNFEIFGDYIVEEGEYIFTLAEMVRKRFNLEEGGNIAWTGDPFEAQLNLTATYRQRVQASDLMPAGQQERTEESSGSANIPVLVKANLSGPLQSPEIHLDLDTEDHGTTTDMANLNLQSAIQRIRADEQELQQQIISLLVLNRFMPRGESQGLIATGVGAGIGELVSTQMSDLLSGISEDVQMGVNYRGADGIYDRELEVTGSTRLLDDRLGITGSYDFENAASSDLEVNYRLTDRGRYQVKAFRRNNQNFLMDETQQGDEIWGFGLSFRHQFDSFGELFRTDTEEERFIPEFNEEQEPESEETAEDLP